MELYAVKRKYRPLTCTIGEGNLTETMLSGRTVHSSSVLRMSTGTPSAYTPRLLMVSTLYILASTIKYDVIA